MRPAALVALALLSGCATTGPEPGIGLLKGCWTSGYLTLRLSPAGDELAGEMTDGFSPIRYAFALNGSRMTVGEGTSAKIYPRVRDKERSDAPGQKQMSFRKSRNQNGTDWLNVTLAGDDLRINSVLINNFQVAPYELADFKRSTCG